MDYDVYDLLSKMSDQNLRKVYEYLLNKEQKSEDGKARRKKDLKYILHLMIDRNMLYFVEDKDKIYKILYWLYKKNTIK